MSLAVPWDLLKQVAEYIVVPVLGGWFLKKVRDRDVRETILHVADSALALAIQKSNGNGFKNLAELVALIVDGMMEDPSTPKVVKKNPSLAVAAARAAIARNSVGLVNLTPATPATPNQ